MRIKLTLALLLFFAIAEAQPNDRSALKTSVGVSRHISEKVTVPSVMVAFEKDFFPRSLIEVNALWMLPTDVSTELEIRELQSFQFGMNFLFKLLEERNQSFNAGLGFSAGLFSTEWEDLLMTEAGTRAELIPGFSIILEYDFILPSQVFFGSRASFSNYDEDRSSWFLGGVFGFRF